jgi:hypothetical protein
MTAVSLGACNASVISAFFGEFEIQVCWLHNRCGESFKLCRQTGVRHRNISMLISLKISRTASCTNGHPPAEIH